MIVRLPGVKRVRAKGRLYHYHRPTGKRIKVDPADIAAFAAEVARLNDEAIVRAQPRPGTLGALIVAYRRSPEFTGLAERTRKDYQRVFDWLQPIDGLPLSALSSSSMLELRDRAFNTHGRRFANYVLQVMSLLATWAKPRNIMANNPAADTPHIRRPKGTPRANRPWTALERAAVLEHAPPELLVGIGLGMFAGYREGDAVRFAWTGYDGSAIQMRQSKTGGIVWMPAHTRLRAILNAAPRKSPVAMVGQRGRPYTVNGFRARFFSLIRRLYKDGKVGKGLTFHGLRHTVGDLIAEAGGSSHDIAAVLGHATISQAEHYSRGADRKKRARSAMRRLERIMP